MMAEAGPQRYEIPPMLIRLSDEDRELLRGIGRES